MEDEQRKVSVTLRCTGTISPGGSYPAQPLHYWNMECQYALERDADTSLFYLIFCAMNAHCWRFHYQPLSAKLRWTLNCFD